MTDYQTLNVRVGNATLAVGLRVLGGRIVLPSPQYQLGPFELWMDEPLDIVDADYTVKNAFPAITLTPDQIEDIPPSWPEDDIRMGEELIAIGKRLALERKEALDLLAPFDGPVE